MIRSMTAFGSGRAESEAGIVTIELRTVNSRFLDINFRMPDDLRVAEGMVRERLNAFVKRGKVDIRVSAMRSTSALSTALDHELLKTVARQLASARSHIPDIPAPRLSELLNAGGDNSADPAVWLPMCQAATEQALIELNAAREREGQRLVEIMREYARQMHAIVATVETALPALLADHQEKITTRLREALESISPDGFAQIKGEELSARIAQEASLFGLRIDVAEELSRLKSHIAELDHLLSGSGNGSEKQNKNSGSAGKRLDFLFQEMNREANTLGSKAGALSVTRAAIDLKLLIEQLREQAQNIE